MTFDPTDEEMVFAYGPGGFFLISVAATHGATPFSVPMGGAPYAGPGPGLPGDPSTPTEGVSESSGSITLDSDPADVWTVGHSFFDGYSISLS